jgi:NADP-dependent 3-hydroxy acid dehydrogenase YdfG
MADAPAWLRAIQHVTGYSLSTLQSPDLETAQWGRELGVSPRKLARALDRLALEQPLDEGRRTRLLAARTVGAWRRELGGSASGGSVDLAAQVAAGTFDPSQLTEERVTEELLDAVVLKTGYARSQLNLDADLEADLGIDSVKQAQVLSHLRKKYPVEFRHGLRLRDYPTLRSWVSFVMEAARNHGKLGLRSTTVAPLRAAVRERLAWVEDGTPVPGALALPSRWTFLQAGEGAFPAALEAQLRATAAGTGGARGAAVLVPGTDRAEEISRWTWAVLAQLRALPLEEGLRVLAVGVGTREGAGENPCFAALSGALKAWAQEEPRVAVALLRAPASACEAVPEAVAHSALGELQRAGGREVAFEAPGQLWVRAAVAEPLRLGGPEAWAVPARPRFVVTGGARGIAAKVATDLAARCGARLVLLGRSAEGHTEVQATLASVRAAGGEVAYVEGDVATAGAARGAFERCVSLWGGVDGVLHAAGVLEDGPLSEKTEEAFCRVLSPKVTGLERLLDAGDALPAFPRTWVAFSSIVAWRGNARQVDYAAANEAMAALLRARCAPHRARVRVLDYGPWADVGMAERTGLSRFLREAGEPLVGVEEGCAALWVELASDGEVMVEATWCPAEVPLLEVASHPADGPGALRERTWLLERVERSADGLHLRATRTLSVTKDLWLQDHSIFEDPLMPGAVGLELLVEAACALLPDLPLRAVEDFRIHAAVTLMGVPTLAVTLKAAAEVGAGPGERVVRCALELGNGGACYTARVRLGGTQQDAERPPAPAFLALRHAPGSDTQDRAAVYARIRLGPAFHLLEQASVLQPPAGGGRARCLGRAGPLRPARFFRQGVPVAHFAAEPLLVESGFHAASWLRLQLADAVVVPRAIRALQVHGPLDVERPAWWAVEEEAAGTFQLSAWQEDGAGALRPVVSLRGYETFDVTAISAWQASAGKAST